MVLTEEVGRSAPASGEHRGLAGPVHRVCTHLLSCSCTAASPPASQAPRGCPLSQPSLARFLGVLGPAQSALCCRKTSAGYTESSVGKGVIGSGPLVLADSEFSEGCRPWPWRPGVVAGRWQGPSHCLPGWALCCWARLCRVLCTMGGAWQMRLWQRCAPFSSPQADSMDTPSLKWRCPDRRLAGRLLPSRICVHPHPWSLPCGEKPQTPVAPWQQDVLP